MPQYKVEFETVEYVTEWFTDPLDDTEYEAEVPEYSEDYDIVDAADDDEARGIIFDTRDDVVSVVRVTLVGDDE